MKKLFHILIIIFISFPTLLVALENKEKVQIKNIKYIGNERVSDQTIRFYTKLEPGSHINDDDVDSVIKDLYKTKLFASINAYIDDEKNLVVKIHENPLINKVILKGNKLFNSKELLNNVIQSKSLTIFTETKLQNDLINLATLYRNSGKIGVKIAYELDKLGSNRINLIFKIKEGRTSKIKGLRFIGNKNFSANELEQVIKRHSNDIFSKLFRAIFKSGTHYSPQYLLINTELLDRFYSSKGYIQNNIQPIVEVDNNNQIELTFLIDEKQQYLFGNNEVDIETEIQDLSLREEILEFIKEENNQIFNRVKINNTAEKISKHLSEKGYIFAKVNPEYTQHNNIVDVTYKVLPGKKIYINQITIDGNDRTLDKVIRRKLSMAEGDAYNTSEIQKSRRKLIYSNFFETVKINSYTVDDNAVNLDLNVKEKRTASLSLTGGMSLPGGVFVKTDFTDRNLFGSGKEVSFALEKSQYVLSTSIDAVENNFNDSDTSLGMGVFYEKQDKPNTTFDTCNWGGIAKVSYKISENLTNSFQYSYKYNHIHMDNKGGKDEDISEIIRDQEGEYQVSSVGYTLSYNKLDNLYTPKEGYLLRLNQDISGLGGNVNFLKSEFLSFYTHPILSKIDDDITLRFKVAAGHIFSYTDEDLNIGQHFFKGGNEIRGFDLSGIGPRAEDKNKSSLGGKTYFNLTQQVDFPLSKLYDYAGIKGSLFVDYATLFGLDEKEGYSGKYYDSKLIRVSPGFGFSMPSPFGRLRLDFGFPLVKEAYDIIPSTNVKISIEAGI
ncbi:outer membrane protein assembly factor BamA [Wolbachia endosymbiont of Drosophila mauritiana]|uniref:outer membrane protein assembly factor BamA n=1 Tax=unclassified Wolbachia TaxID=2640676 RepID=UPI00107E6D3D|nr:MULTISPECIES: outer membrane protein assembly factor BamA [unclassified Wolbachia]QCB62231.1 outer membrane protein assembly factor BamA [Wolbachia endosymbiont of Drosophila mauritiana]QCB63278.1 outer membrane protein assembly factor BamA [Wolbachia endosymbiont of Drosophila mauritiana]QWE33459.1 Outer membrane protein assembly factor BamA (Precursor) [Wolbachia endosymbiont of Drosophila simulans]TGB07726.1 outer membrane protein assembly factor BamA [Wolbachia endosymbiont of Drosophila